MSSGRSSVRDAVATVADGLRHPVSGGWPPLAWTSVLLATAPLVLPALVLLGYLVAVARSAARDAPAPSPGAVRGPMRDGAALLAALAILAVLVAIGAAGLYLLVFLPTWTTEHPILWLVDVVAALAAVYAAAGAIAVLAGTGRLDDAVGARLAEVCLSRYFLATVTLLVAAMLLAVELALRLGGPVAAGVLAPYLAMAWFATLGRSYRGAEDRGLVPIGP